MGAVPDAETRSVDWRCQTAVVVRSTVPPDVDVPVRVHPPVDASPLPSREQPAGRPPPGRGGRCGASSGRASPRSEPFRPPPFAKPAGAIVAPVAAADQPPSQLVEPLDQLVERGDDKVRDMARVCLEATPWPAPQPDGSEAGGAGRHDIVVHPITDIGDASGVWLTRQLEDPGEEAGIRLGHAKLLAHRDHVRPEPEGEELVVAGRGLIGDDGDAEAGSVDRLERAQGIGMQVLVPEAAERRVDLGVARAPVRDAQQVEGRVVREGACDREPDRGRHRERRDADHPAPTSPRFGSRRSAPRRRRSRPTRFRWTGGRLSRSLRSSLFQRHRRRRSHHEDSGGGPAGADGHAVRRGDRHRRPGDGRGPRPDRRVGAVPYRLGDDARLPAVPAAGGDRPRGIGRRGGRRAGGDPGRRRATTSRCRGARTAATASTATRASRSCARSRAPLARRASSSTAPRGSPRAASPSTTTASSRRTPSGRSSRSRPPFRCGRISRSTARRCWGAR